MNDGEQYGLSCAAILADMQRLRDNAHAYNRDADSVELRIMADALLHYFQHLLRVSLLSLRVMGDDVLAAVLITADIAPLLSQPDHPDVAAFLALQQRERAEKEREREREREKAAAARLALQQQQLQPQYQPQQYAPYDDDDYWGQGGEAFDLGFDDGFGYGGGGGTKKQKAPKRKKSQGIYGGGGGDFVLDDGGGEYDGEDFDDLIVYDEVPEAPVVTRQVEAWEQAALTVLNKIGKHVYVVADKAAAGNQARSQVTVCACAC